MRSFALIVFALLVSGSAFATPNTCFYARGAGSFRVVASDMLDISEGGRIFRLRLSFCSSLRFADRIAFDQFSGPWICQNDKLVTLDYRGRVMDRCWIDDVTQIR